MYDLVPPLIPFDGFSSCLQYGLTNPVRGIFQLSLKLTCTLKDLNAFQVNILLVVGARALALLSSGPQGVVGRMLSLKADAD